MRVLVTGGSGFVATHIIDGLSSLKNVEVLAASRKKVSGAVSRRNVNFFEAPDISDSNGWSRLLDGVDVIIHTAAKAHGGRSDQNRDESEIYRVNVEFTLLLASLAKNSGVRRFVFLSSIGVNGNQSIEAIGVESEASPKGEYARSKYDAEKGLQDIASGAEFDVVIVRPPLVYGPDAPGSFGLLTRVVAKRVPLPLSGINNQRSFISVWNLVSLIVTCLDHPKASNQVFVVSDGGDVSTSELLVKIGAASGCPVKLFWIPKALLKAGAILLRKRELYDKLFSSLKVDDGHARNTLGWTPPLTLDEGLRRCFTD